MVKLSSSEYAACRRLAIRLNLPRQMILGVVKSDSITNDHYHIELQEKPSGGERIIHKPFGDLKLIQSFIDAIIFDKLPVSDISHAYRKKRSTGTNARCHIDSHDEICLDIEDAYFRTSLTKVFVHLWSDFDKREMLRNDFCVDLGTLHVIAKLVEIETSYGKGLPQGAPTSPKLFNYLCRELDEHLNILAYRFTHTVSRYCDNIFISSDSPITEGHVHAYIRYMSLCGFPLNTKKTRVIHNGNRQGVPMRTCGINIMEGDLSLPPNVIRRLKNRLFYAGLQGRADIRNGIKGYVFSLYDGWPTALKDAYRKGRQRAYEIAQWNERYHLEGKQAAFNL